MGGNTISDGPSSRWHFSKMRSSGLVVERRRPGRALSVDLAAHIAIRYPNGKIAVVTGHPQAFMSSVRKQWLRLIRLAQREQASTLSRQRKDDLGEVIYSMQAIGFTAKDPADEPLAYVSFATVEQFIASPPQCATLYITEPIPKLSQHMIVSWMPRSGRVVIYEQR
ncbi:MAG TPA: hypothetical protein VFT87_02955 [Candidatus Saccharimonadales bacterium]|nr:hypothetical protein [Candidatus Saccharimonadales bacterium]